MKMAKATIRKSTVAWMKAPYLISTGVSAVPMLAVSSDRSTPLVMAPTMGMMIASTSDETILPKAPPITTPTARSMTLPRIANCLNSVSRLIPFSLVVRRPPGGTVQR